LSAKFADDFVSPPKSTRTNLGVRLAEEFEGEAPEPEAQGRRDLRTPELMARYPDLGILRGLGILLIEEDLEEDLPVARLSSTKESVRSTGGEKYMSADMKSQVEAEIEEIVSGLWFPSSLIKDEVAEQLKRLFGDAVSDVDYEVDTGTVILTPTKPLNYISMTFTLPEGSLTDEDLECINKGEDSHDPAPSEDF